SAADDHAEYAAAAADEADAAQYDHEDHIEDLRADNDEVGLHVAGLTNPDQAGQPGENCDQHMLEHDQRAKRDSRQSRGFGIITLRVNEAANGGARQESVHDKGG